MYVCICRGVTDGQIRDAVRQGCSSRKDLVKCLDVGRGCGKCRAEIRSVLRLFAEDPAATGSMFTRP